MANISLLSSKFEPEALEKLRNRYDDCVPLEGSPALAVILLLNGYLISRAVSSLQCSALQSCSPAAEEMGLEMGVCACKTHSCTLWVFLIPALSIAIKKLMC